MNKELEKTYIFGISHPNFAERHVYLTDHLSKITQYTWEIVGVDGHALAKTANFSKIGHSSNLSPGQIGCSLAHCVAYTRMRDLGLSVAVIIEDDVQLPNNFDAIISEVIKKIKPGEVISLHNPMMKKNLFSSKNTEQVIDMKLYYPMSPRSIRSTSAYVISIEAALDILAINDPVRHVADHWDAFYDQGCVRSYRILHPSPCRWLPSDSVIGYGAHEEFREFFKKNLLTNALIKMRRQYIFWKRIRNVRLIDATSPLEND